MDALFYGNLTWFINHMPETICNVDVREYYSDGSRLILFFSRKEIPQDAEIYFNYGKTYNLQWKKELTNKFWRNSCLTFKGI